MTPTAASKASVFLALEFTVPAKRLRLQTLLRIEEEQIRS